MALLLYNEEPVEYKKIGSYGDYFPTRTGTNSVAQKHPYVTNKDTQAFPLSRSSGATSSSTNKKLVGDKHRNSSQSTTDISRGNKKYPNK